MGWGSDSGVLLLNNFMQKSDISELEGTGYDSGNVLAYNYFRDSSTTQVYSGDAEHTNGSPNFILREGNQFGVSEDDGTWGTHNFDTWFRNNISCYDGPFVEKTRRAASSSTTSRGLKTQSATSLMPRVPAPPIRAMDLRRLNLGSANLTRWLRPRRCAGAIATPLTMPVAL